MMAPDSQRVMPVFGSSMQGTLLMREHQSRVRQNKEVIEHGRSKSLLTGH